MVSEGAFVSRVLASSLDLPDASHRKALKLPGAPELKWSLFLSRFICGGGGGGGGGGMRGAGERAEGQRRRRRQRRAGAPGRLRPGRRPRRPLT